MKILFKVDKVKNPSSKNAWTSADQKFMISDRIASVLPASILVIKGNTAVLHGTPITNEVFNETTKLSAGFRLVGVEGTVVDSLVLIDAQQEAAKAAVPLTSASAAAAI